MKKKKKQKQKKIKLEKCIKKLVKQYFSHTKNTKNINNGGYLHGELISRVERELIKQVLKQTQQNQSQTARVLGISRTTLRKKMADFDLL